jgi:hypothetical protein
MKLTTKNILFCIWLFVVGGCVGTTFSGGSFPIYPRPLLPKALISPADTFIKCGDDFYCITPEDLEGLRKWVIRIQGVIEKYEHAQETINGSSP